MAPQQEPSPSAKIVEWDQQKGFGYLQVGKQRVFLHRRDFIEHHKRPTVGDTIHFKMGRDPKGRPCAIEASQANDGGRIGIVTVVALAGLLYLPVVALRKHGVEWHWSACYFLALSGITYRAYAADKQRARAKAWRISEKGLHLLELLGGWPGGLLAQRALRHKCSKAGYQFIFWSIVLVHQFAAFDSLQDWELTRGLFNAMETGLPGETSGNRGAS